MVPGTRTIKDTRGADIDLGPVAPLIERIVESWRPVSVWLFGSRARGEAGTGSDWDLLVVLPDESPEIDDPLAGWRLKRALPVRSDVLVCRSSEFDEDHDTPNTIAFEATHGGIRIYER